MRLFREPLVQFLLLGTLLFLLYIWSGRGNVEPDEIAVTRSTIERLVKKWRLDRNRPPTSKELQTIIDDYLVEEILYREAKALRLDEDDIVIRRRLREKIESLAGDSAYVKSPTDDELDAYRKSNPSRFRLDATISFEQIFFNEEIRGSSTGADVAVALRSLRDRTAGDPSQLGDGIPLPYELEATSSWEVASMFGSDFADKLPSQPVGEWAGPVRSDMGLHLVRVNELDPGRDPAPDEVRDVVAREWAAEQRRRVKERFYGSLLDRYEVTIEETGRAISGESSPH